VEGENAMVTYAVEENKLVCRFDGRMDTDNCLKVEKELCGKIQGADLPVVFDLEKTDYIASLFLGLCARICKDVGADRFILVNVCPEVKKVFKIARLDGPITIR
jgi:anti-anti-sigma factor